MGIGLSISRSIIERHGDRMRAPPNEGAGAAFSFSVTIVADDATSPGTTVRVEAARLTERESK
jgi:K+-sensing histidine kinase KdpD